MMGPCGRWLGGLGLLVVLPILVGCSSGPAVQQGDMENLRKVATAYQEATRKLNHPPRNAEELKPFLRPHGDPDALLRSPNDGQPFVILWGQDTRTPPQGLKPLVIGYEKTGQGGKRFVFTAMGVVLMTDEDFAQANFPKGHKPG